MKLITNVLYISFLGLSLGLTIVRSQERPEPQCGEPVDGLLFCASTPKVVVPFGGSVVIKMSLKNTTDEPVSIPVGRLGDYYPIRLTDRNGNKVSSIREEALERINQGVGNNEDWGKTLVFGGRCGPSLVQAGRELSVESDTFCGCYGFL